MDKLNSFFSLGAIRSHVWGSVFMMTAGPLASTGAAMDEAARHKARERERQREKTHAEHVTSDCMSP